jgi:hypothetical protein
MSEHVNGVHRDQTILFPDTLDKYVDAENPVRFIDAFIDSLNLDKLGFKHSILADTGRRLACGIVNRNRFGLATENRQQWRFSVALEASVDCLLSLLVWCMLCLIGCGRCRLNKSAPTYRWRGL